MHSMSSSVIKPGDELQAKSPQPPSRNAEIVILLETAISIIQLG
jgi:hypothetical protein